MAARGTTLLNMGRRVSNKLGMAPMQGPPAPRRHLKRKAAGGLGALGALTAANPAVGTAVGIGAATTATFAGARRGIRAAAAQGADPSTLSGARSFAYRRPGTTAALAGLPLSGALYSGGPGRGSAASKRNQSGYYMNAMRRGQGSSSGVAGIAAHSLGGLA